MKGLFGAKGGTGVGSTLDALDSLTGCPSVPFAESTGFSFGAADSIALAQVINAIKPK